MTLDQYLSRVMPHVAGCPAIVAEQAITDAADELLRKSRLIREAVPMAVLANQAEYEVEPETFDLVLSEVLSIRIDDGDPIHPLSADQEAAFSSSGRTPEAFSQDGAVITLHPTPAEDATASVVLVLTVGTTASEIPAALDRWRDGVVSGAIARLCIIRGQPWTDPQAAAMHRDLFNSIVDQAAAHATLGNGKTTLRVQAHP